MKKLLGISSFLILLVGCGGAGSGEGELTVTSAINKVEQDLICCTTWQETTDENGATTGECQEYATPATKTIEITLKQADISKEFAAGSDLLFEECTVRIIPNPSLPDAAKDEGLLETMVNYTHCTGTDIPADGSGVIEITYSQGLLETIYPVWIELGGRTLNYTIEVTAKYTSADGEEEYIKVIKVPIDFSDFILAEHDMCTSTK